jgi:hypothetical protein
MAAAAFPSSSNELPIWGIYVAGCSKMIYCYNWCRVKVVCSCVTMSVIYRNIVAIADKFVPPRLQPLWNHEAGKPSFTSSFLVADVTGQGWNILYPYDLVSKEKQNNFTVRWQRSPEFGLYTQSVELISYFATESGPIYNY